MAIRDDFIFHPEANPRYIIIKSPSTEVFIQDIVDTSRVWEAGDTGIANPKILDASGKEPLGGGVSVGITATLRNCQIGFEGRSGPNWVQCRISGGNLVNIGDGDTELYVIYPTSYVQVIMTSSSSATLQELTSIQYSSFDGGVWIDTINGTNGTAFPSGTPEQPVKTLADAKTIAAGRGFEKLNIIGNMTFGDSEDISNYTIIGQNAIKSTFTLSSGVLTNSTQFKNATVMGTLSGNTWIEDCKIGTLNYVEGRIQNCVLLDVITLSGPNVARILNCIDGLAGLDISPEIDMGDSGRDLVLENYSGTIKIKNLSGEQKVDIGIEQGHVHLEDSITAGSFFLSGIGTLHDSTGGTASVNSDGLISKQTISNAVWEEILGDTVAYKLLADSWYIAGGNRLIQNNREYFYKQNGDTAMIFKLLNESGDSTMTNVYQRVRIY